MDQTSPLNVSLEEDYLRQVVVLARQAARRYLLLADAGDIAQEIVLDCLTSLRSGKRPYPAEERERVVRTMVRRHCFNAMRARERRACRDAEHERDLVDSPHVWMCPELGVTQRELDEFYEKTLMSMPPTCRRVYVMVAEEEMTYRAVANTLGISRAAVNGHIVIARRHFRAALREHEIGAIAPLTSRANETTEDVSEATITAPAPHHTERTTEVDARSARAS